MTPRVPVEERRQIIRYFLEGIPQREICRLTNRSRDAVSRAIHAYRDEEGRLGDAQRSGRSRSTTQEEDLKIIAAVVEDPFQSAKEIREALQLNVSAKTIQRRLHEASVLSCVAAQKPHLTDKQRLARLEFARAAQQWSVQDWGEVIFIDESTFSTCWDQQRRVWRPVNCRYEGLLSPLQRTTRFGE